MDGLFNQAALTDIDNVMGGVDTYVDAWYKESLKRDAAAKLPYKMGVSPRCLRRSGSAAGSRCW